MATIDEKEICRQFREAKDKAGMVLILSQLNDCSREVIVDVLEKNGFEDPRKTQKKKPKPINKIPDAVYKVLTDRMDFIEVQIKSLENEYQEIADYLCKTKGDKNE